MIRKHRLVISTVRNRPKITLAFYEKVSIVRLLIYKQPELELDKASESASQDCKCKLHVNTQSHDCECLAIEF